jgi:hypothetical protein
MSDDLVKRLLNTPNWMREGFQDWKDNVRTYDRAPFEAADRIEELEAKLAVATRALEAIARPKTGPDADWTMPEIYRWRAIWYLRHEERARAVLAELKEDKG